MLHDADIARQVVWQIERRRLQISIPMVSLTQSCRLGYKEVHAMSVENTHSADVQIDLHINGQVLPISHLGPSWFILTDSIDHPPTHAEIELSIDDHIHRWPVFLSEGISTSREHTLIGYPVPVHAPTPGLWEH
jgi:hypothetical protein